MRYFIDGYNLLFRFTSSDRELKALRNELINEIAEKVELLSLDAVIIFDGTKHVDDLEKKHYRFIEIIFTAHGETADEYIVSELEVERKIKEKVTVVTSDRALAQKCKNLEANTITVEQFLSWLNQRTKQVQKKKKRSDSPLDALSEPTRPKPAPTPPAIKIQLEDDYLSAFENELKEAGQPLNVDISSRKQVCTSEKKFFSDEERYLNLFEGMTDIQEEK